MSDNTTGFIVASCLRSDDHLGCLIRCLYCIRALHPDQGIVVIVDFSSVYALVQKAIETNPSVIFEYGTEGIPADMLFLKYFRDKKYFARAVLLQDSMILKKPIDTCGVNDVQYLWHFTNHRVHWNIISEPDDDFNRANNINVHDDLNMYIINNIIQSVGFRDYCKYIYFRKDEWCGCFGTCCILTHDFLAKLDAATDIIHIQLQMKTNRLRRAIESIFSLACQYVTARNMENGHDGLYYDGTNGHMLNGDIISKESFNRQ